MANVKIDALELARLQEKAAAHDTLTRQTDQAFRLIQGAPQFLEQLTKIASPATDNNSSVGTPGPDGKTWQVDFDVMTLIILPYKDEIQLVDKSNVVPIGHFRLSDGGSLSSAVQTSIIGYAERIVRANADGADPVVDVVSLLGQVTPA